MSPEFHQRVRKLFDEALERPEEGRLAFLKTACSGDSEAYNAVARLIKAHPPAQSFLENRAPGMERIGRYLITGELGRGAMGVVYEAIDPLIRRSVAVKVIHIESLADQSEADFMRDRLFREARSAGQLLHPGIVILFDVGQEGDLAFITMERVDGLSLQRILASGRTFTHREALDVLRQTATALDYAHQRNIVHCDVKPGNIILDKSGTAKLTDFGIAKITSTQFHTRSGLLMGTPSYMSPEQIEGQPLDGRSDQFSLAVVAFQLLTGSLPFQANTIASMAYAIVHAPRPSASGVNPELTAGVDQVLKRGLDALPGNRFPNCATLVTALEEALTVGAKTVRVEIAASSPLDPYVPTERHQIGGVRWYLGGTFVAVLAAVGGYRFIAQSRSVSSPQERPSVAAPSAVQFRAESSSVKAVDSPPGLVAISPPQIGAKTVPVTVEKPPGAATLFTKAIAERRAGRLEAALPLFRQAAELGDTRAMQEMGSAAADGEGMPKNYTEAVRWFRMAADRGNSASMLLLGGMYYMGEGVPKDAALAVYWFSKASDSGDPAGKYDLGVLYENGIGVSKDAAKAALLYQDAARLGHDEAKKRLVQLQVAGH